MTTIVRTASWCAPLVGLALATPPAVAQDAASIVRSASRMQAIRDVCPPYVGTDRNRANAYMSAFRDVGVKLLGGQGFATAMQREQARHRGEIQAATPSQWCADQRASLNELGITDVLTP